MCDVFQWFCFGANELVWLLVAACFLEHWKRRQMCLKHSWDLTSLEDEEVLTKLFKTRGAHVRVKQQISYFKIVTISYDKFLLNWSKIKQEQKEKCSACIHIKLNINGLHIQHTCFYCCNIQVNMTICVHVNIECILKAQVNHHSISLLSPASLTCM